MYIDRGGGIWKNKKNLKKKIFKDNINPINRVYIVLFVLHNIRDPPRAFSIKIKIRRMLMYTKENKNLYENVSKSGSLFRDYIIEAQNPIQKILNKEAVAMINESLVVNQFKKKIRKSLNNFRIDIYRLGKKQRERELLTEELFDVETVSCDEYDFLENKVVVMDFKMTVKNDLLYEVLNSMEQQQRDIIYLSLCEDWSDREIGEKLKMSRAKVQRIKQKLKKEIYEVMTGGIKHENKR